MKPLSLPGKAVVTLYSGSPDQGIFSVSVFSFLPHWMASDLEMTKGRRDFPIRTFPVMCHWLLCLKGCGVFFLKVLAKEAVMF